MRTTKTAPAAKTTKISRAVPQDKTARTAKVIDDSSMFDEVMKRYAEAQEAMLAFFKTPSWKRTLVAVVTYLAGVVGVGFLTSALIDFVLVGAVTLGAPIFLTIIVAVLGAILLAWYGHKCVMRVAGAVLTGEADERAIAAYDAVKSFASRLNPFKRATVEAV